MKLLLSIVLIGFSICSFAQHTDELAIRNVLSAQEAAWNKGDIDAFMDGYWNSDSLLFIGASGVTYGHANTLRRYKTNYNSQAKMGRLKFDLLHFLPLATDYWMIVGKWQLTRDAGDVGGHFTLLFKKINGKWVIVSDHTS